MQIQPLTGVFSVCKVADYSGVALNSSFCFIGKTDEECSLVCLTEDVPLNVVARSDGWRGFRIAGQLDFALTGILSRIATLLVEAKIAIFAVSTFRTDYILVKEEQFDMALDTLALNGYEVESYQEKVK